MIINTAERISDVKEYYFATKLREIRKRNLEGEDIINLGIGNPDMMPSENVVKKLVATAIEEGNHGYQPYKGILPLRMAMADWYLNAYGVSLNSDSEILPLIGSKEGIMHICMAFLDKGDGVLIPNPGYPSYGSVARLVGAETHLYNLSPENGWYPDLDELRSRDLSKVKLMWINYPHMPTGTAAKEEVFQELVAFAKEHQILLCHDNPYSYVLNPEPMSILNIPGAKEVAIELNSLSKSHNMAGWRVGMVVGQEAYLNAIIRVKSNMDSGMFAPLQYAAAEALQNSRDWHAERNGIYAERRKIVWEMIKVLNCEADQEQVGMFVWAKITSHINSAEAYSEEILNRCSVFITPGFIFGSGGEKYIRISLCNTEDRLTEALDRLTKVFAITA